VFTPYYGAYTACLFFQRDFYLKYRPTFFVPEDERSSEKYKIFCKKFEHIPHAGAGYLFKAYSEGLSWYPLRESNKGNAHYGYICSIYDDLVFHLAVWTYSEYEIRKNTSLICVRKWSWKHFWFPIFRILFSGTQQQALGTKKFFIPRHLMSLGWKHLGFPMFFTPIQWHERKQLLEDPESYLNYLRTVKDKDKYSRIFTRLQISLNQLPTLKSKSQRICYCLKLLPLQIWGRLSGDEALDLPT
jgi:hypothetical protein